MSGAQKHIIFSVCGTPGVLHEKIAPEARFVIFLIFLVIPARQTPQLEFPGGGIHSPLLLRSGQGRGVTLLGGVTL